MKYITLETLLTIGYAVWFAFAVMWCGVLPAIGLLWWVGWLH